MQPEQGAICSFKVQGKNVLQVEKVKMIGQRGMAQVFLVKTLDDQQLVLRKIVYSELNILRLIIEAIQPFKEMKNENVAEIKEMFLFDEGYSATLFVFMVRIIYYFIESRIAILFFGRFGKVDATTKKERRVLHRRNYLAYIKTNGCCS